MTSPEVGIEQATQQALLRAASREAENNEGTRRLALSYTKNDGIWYSHSRLEKEGPLEVRDVDSLPCRRNAVTGVLRNCLYTTCVMKNAYAMA